MNTQENNRMIAEWMGVKNVSEAALHWLCYDRSWNRLMPVIERIAMIEFAQDEEEQNDGTTRIIRYTHYPRTFGMPTEDGKWMFRFNCGGLHIGDTLIEAAYEAVVEFVEQKVNEKIAQ